MQDIGVCKQAIENAILVHAPLRTKISQMCAILT